MSGTNLRDREARIYRPDSSKRFEQIDMNKFIENLQKDAANLTMPFTLNTLIASAINNQLDYPRIYVELKEL